MVSQSSLRSGIAIGLAVFILSVIAWHQVVLAPRLTSLPECTIRLQGPIHLRFADSGNPPRRIADIGTGFSKTSLLWPVQFSPDCLPTTEDLWIEYFDSSSSEPPEIQRIGRRNEVLYDASICPVHRETMHRTRVPADFQANLPDAGVDANRFPNCGRAPSHCPQPTRQRWCWVCDSCRREHDRWLERALGPPPQG